ncbi:MAG: hypothetical protein VX899_22475 [Myxococcota bacterium]|nr:hypothetical protein [Myxococcota bacterium]
MIERAQAAIERWAQALNQPLDQERFSQAFTPDAQVRRHGWGARIDTVVEVLDGPDAIAEWAQGANRNSVFIVEQVQPEPDGVHYRARYRLEILNFLNRGWWRFSLGEDGRIHQLWHRADALLDPAMRRATLGSEEIP